MFINTNFPWQLFELIKVLEIKTSTISNLAFANNTISLCFFFLIIHLCFLIPAAIMEVSVVITELSAPTGIPTKEEKIEIETHPVTVQAKIIKCSI